MCFSVHQWMIALKNGEDEAAQALWNEFFVKLCRRIAPHTQSLRLVDNEDIAASAFAEFFDAIKRDKFLDVETLDDVWSLLATIASRRTKDSQRHEHRMRRGGSVKTFSFDDVREQLANQSNCYTSFDFSRLLIDLYRAIDDERLAKVLNWKMEGCSTSEIAQRLGCGERNVQYLEAELTKRIKSFSRVTDFRDVCQYPRVPFDIERSV